MSSANPPKEVYAEHGVGFDRYSGAHVPTTFFYGDEAKRDRLGYVHGHLADGALYRDSFSQLKFVRLIGAQARRAA